MAALGGSGPGNPREKLRASRQPPLQTLRSQHRRQDIQPSSGQPLAHGAPWPRTQSPRARSNAATARNWNGARFARCCVQKSRRPLSLQASRMKNRFPRMSRWHARRHGISERRSRRPRARARDLSKSVKRVALRQLRQRPRENGNCILRACFELRAVTGREAERATAAARLQRSAPRSESALARFPPRPPPMHRDVDFIVRRRCGATKCRSAMWPR